MRYLFNLFLITGGRYPKPFDANFRAKGPFINVTKPTRCIRQLADRRNLPRYLVGRGENFPRATYLP